ncbi:MAG TPA: S8 family serine peptidase [Gaiellaceae bacterium]|nr:S8 family serine peptidase [Gaiellaceae bacterium]
MRTPPWRSFASAAVVLGAVVAALLLLAFTDRNDEAGRARAARPGAAAWRGLLGAPRASVALGQRVIVVLKAPSLADRVRQAGGVATIEQERRWTAAALAGQEQFLFELAADGIVARPDFQFTRVLNGFSAVADSSAAVLLERLPQVAGVYPVRAAFPSTTSGTVEGTPLPALPAGYRGAGVTVALLDTAVDPATPYLHGRVLPGFDILEGGPAARYDQKPGGDRLETHGTATAGIVAGLGRPGTSVGVAPEVTVLPIRVAGWQRDAAGRWSVHGRTDQLIAGLERAVDPNRNGDAHDAARITLIPLSEPFAAFPGGPLASAVAGAMALDSLVVVPAGNDGPGGPGFGSIGGPGGAPEALTVGAADLQPVAGRTLVSIRAGLRVLLAHRLELLTSAAPAAGTSLELVAVRNGRELFTRDGRSRVAGRAVLVAAGTAPRVAALRAADAGAAVVLLAGDELPGGALGLDPELTVPALSAPASLIGEVREHAAGGTPVTLAVGETRDLAPGARSVAAFSSWGSAFGAQVKPDVVTAGVAVRTALPGADASGHSRFVTVSGTSAAAAVAAGVAARLAHARPSLDASGLRSALIGTARPLARSPLVAQGVGAIDGGRAAVAELVADEGVVSFGRGAGDGWQGRRTLILRNVSTRTLFVDAAVRGGGGVVLRLAPERFRIPAGGTRRLRVAARVAEVARADFASGVIAFTPRGGQALAVPWSVLLAPPPSDLIGDVHLSERSFAPSDLTPAVLSVRLGTIERAGSRDVLQPVRRLDVYLVDADGSSLGLLARLRDVLPGQYAFGLTGRGQDGRALASGPYVLRLVAWPEAGGRAVKRTVRFAVE